MEDEMIQVPLDRVYNHSQGVLMLSFDQYLILFRKKGK